MNEKEYQKKIEELNLENIQLKKSKEYATGKKILQVKSMLKKMQICKLVKKIFENRKISKFSNIEKENNFKVKEKQKLRYIHVLREIMIKKY